MANKIFVKAAAGRRVRLPGGRVVPEAGVPVTRDIFVERCLARGDLIEVPQGPAGLPAEAPRVTAPVAAKKEG